MIHALHIGKFFPPFPGGIEFFLADLMPAQQLYGWQVAALVHHHIKTASHRLNPNPAELVQEQAIYRAPCYGRLLYAPLSPQFPFWLNHLISQMRPQILHLHLPNTSAFWALSLPAARQLPWVVHWHADVISNIDKRLSLAYHLYRPFEQALLKRATAIIATSPPYLESSLPLQAHQAKTHVVPLGIASQRLPEPSSVALQWAQGHWTAQQATPFKILTIGRLTYYKGHEVLIHAAATLVKQGVPVQVLIAGQGEQKAKLAALIAELNLTQHVQLLGYCADDKIQGLLASCDCFCLPSLERTEAFGMVLIEAMRYSKPVVASRIEGAGVTWIVQPETGILCSPHDSDAFAAALLRLQQNPNLRQQLGKAGQQRFEQVFKIERVAQKMGEIYRPIIMQQFK